MRLRFLRLSRSSPRHTARAEPSVLDQSASLETRIDAPSIGDDENGERRVDGLDNSVDATATSFATRVDASRIGAQVRYGARLSIRPQKQGAANGAAGKSVRTSGAATTTSLDEGSTPGATDVARLATAATPEGSTRNEPRYCCQSKHYPARLHAGQLALLIFTGSPLDEPVTASQAQDEYRHACLELHWLPQAWNTVSHQLTLLLQTRKAYRVCSTDGTGKDIKRQRVFLPPTAQQWTVIHRDVVGRCSVTITLEEREQPWPGIPTTPHCPHVPYPCPLWRRDHVRP
jgi:hypothetical protein